MWVLSSQVRGSRWLTIIIMNSLIISAPLTESYCSCGGHVCCQIWFRVDLVTYLHKFLFCDIVLTCFETLLFMMPVKWSVYCVVESNSLYRKTHTFSGPFSRTTRVSRYQKGKINLDFTEARDSEWQWHRLGHMQVCTLLQTDNHTSTPPLSFLQAGCPSCRPTNSVKALKAHITHCTHSSELPLAGPSMTLVWHGFASSGWFFQWHFAQ